VHAADPAETDRGTPGPLIRTATVQDAAGVGALLQRVSAETRYRRFFSTSSLNVTLEIRAVEALDGHDRVGVVAEVDGCVVAFGRWIRTPGGADTAILVDDAYQGHGLGRAIAQALTDAARAEGLAALTYAIQADNLRALRFAAAGARDRRATRFDGAVVEGTYRVA
jgi:GNAT superfamily N-acetyltransferase